MKQPLTKKKLGQHWLSDDASLQAMCQAAQITTGDIVLEIGPGHGTLTKYLIARASQTIAVELDAMLANTLPSRMAANNLQVIHQDILNFDFNLLPVDYKVVSNIPYYLTSNLIRVLSETTNPAAKVVLLVQKEVAERVAAPIGKMSILSVTAQYFWQVTLGVVVPAHLFTPPPKVDSQILIMQRRPEALLDQRDAKQLFRLVKAGFSQKRKTLVNALSAGLDLSRVQTTKMLQQADLSPTARAQTLSLADWNRLYLVHKSQINK